MSKIDALKNDNINVYGLLEIQYHIMSIYQWGTPCKIISLNLKKEYDNNAGLLKDTIIWEIERGKNLTDEDIKIAKKKRLFLAKKINKILNVYNFLILPSAQIFPFSKRDAFPKIISEYIEKNIKSDKKSTKKTNFFKKLLKKTSSELT